MSHTSNTVDTKRGLLMQTCLLAAWQWNLFLSRISSKSSFDFVRRGRRRLSFGVFWPFLRGSLANDYTCYTWTNMRKPFSQLNTFLFSVVSFLRISTIYTEILTFYPIRIHSKQFGPTRPYTQTHKHTVMWSFNVIFEQDFKYVPRN